jgi:hypothetical protein
VTMRNLEHGWIHNSLSLQMQHLVRYATITHHDSGTASYENSGACSAAIVLENANRIFTSTAAIPIRRRRE